MTNPHNELEKLEGDLATLEILAETAGGREALAIDAEIDQLKESIGQIIRAAQKDHHKEERPPLKDVSERFAAYADTLPAYTDGVANLKKQPKVELVGVHGTVEVPGSVVQFLVNLVINDREPKQVTFQFGVCYSNDTIIVEMRDSDNKVVWDKTIYNGMEDKQ